MDSPLQPGILGHFTFTMDTQDPRRRGISPAHVYEEIPDLDRDLYFTSRSSTPSTGSSTITAEHDGKQTGNTFLDTQNGAMETKMADFDSLEANGSAGVLTRSDNSHTGSSRISNGSYTTTTGSGARFPGCNSNGDFLYLSPVDGAVKAGSLSAKDCLECVKRRESNGGIDAHWMDRGSEDYNRGVAENIIGLRDFQYTTGKYLLICIFFSLIRWVKTFQSEVTV